MPHSGGGGSHHSGGHHGGSHHSGAHSSSGSSTVRVQSTPFAGCHTYAVYDKRGGSRLVYSSSRNYHKEKTKADVIIGSIMGAVFMLPGFVELVLLIMVLASFIHTGVHITKIPAVIDKDIVITDEFDLVSSSEEEQLSKTLEEFRNKTGIIPSVEFTKDEMWIDDYMDLESYAYNEYVCKFYDEYHLLIIYSFSYENPETGFNDFYWESMWGDDLSKTASTRDEDYLADTIQANLSRANGKNVANAIAVSFERFYEYLDKPGFRVDTDKLFLVAFLLVHGGIFFAVGTGIVKSSVKEYKKSVESGEKTYRINGEPVVLKCAYCGTTYYKGTIGNCHNCGAPLND